MESNLSDYFGGLDKHGRTNANRKETYHNLLSKMIQQQENGKLYSSFVIIVFYIVIIHISILM
jgi:hypothetical protein